MMPEWVVIAGLFTLTACGMWVVAADAGGGPLGPDGEG
jgi:hypothetical protein